MKVIKDLGMFPYGNKGRKHRKYLVQCADCKKEYAMTANFLRTKKSDLCVACNNRINNNSKTHGETKTRLFEAWNRMIQRCYGQGQSKDFKDYKDKGVTVCDEWRHDFLAFKEWSLANGHEEGLSIDKDILCSRLNIEPRIYSPDTCMWITIAQNTAQRNREQRGIKRKR